MRITDITEAPLADFGLYGEATPSTFDDNDLRAINNPKWKAKLISTFARTPFPVNIYLINKSRYTNQRPNSDAPDDILISPNLGELRQIAGRYSIEDFETNFGFTPKDAENSFTVVMTNNYGDGKMALTPWIIAHRIIHAIGTDHHYTRNSDANLTLSRYWKHIMAVMNTLTAYKTEFNEITKAASQLKSAQSGYDRPGEFYIELATQFFLYGDFKFDLEAACRIVGISPTPSQKYNLEQARAELSSMMGELKGRIFVMLIASCIGRLPARK